MTEYGGGEYASESSGPLPRPFCGVPGHPDYAHGGHPEPADSVPVPVLEALASDWERRAGEMERRSRAPGSFAAWGAQAETLRAAANQLRAVITAALPVPGQQEAS